MIKKSLYPKTKRVGKDKKNKIVITEKLDGSNLGFFKLGDELYIAQRNNVFKLSELEEDAKARINEELEISNMVYDLGLLHYAFSNQKIPETMELVPLVAELDLYPSVGTLDELYDTYKTGDTVEGFIINDKNVIRKYVRHKNGKLEPHKG